MIFAAGLALAAASSESSCETNNNKEIIQTTRKLSKGIKVFSGNANPALSEEVVKHLDISLGKITVGRFSDGEVLVQVNEHIRGRDVYLIQPTLPPVNETLMELLLMISTCRRASARKITAIIPYYGYARQDRKMQARVPISAADVARLLEAVGVDRVVSVDLHCGQIQGFFRPRVPVDNLEGFTVGVGYFGDMDLVSPVIVSPDAGGVYRAKQFRDRLLRKHEMDCGLAMIIKQRAKTNAIERMDLVGSVDGCDVILVDDMVDTAGTLCKAVDVLLESGARRVFAFCSHGVLSGPAAQRIADSQLTELVILDTIPMSEECKATKKIKQLSVGPLLAQAISNIHNRKSISALFK
ncbi:phosphoribosyltransferase-like protein [Ochromonadaceae sp. CCMP2298]|nr:phosphoribosyltransferase-like protein [Ochromonadaceae sp. CCMP2298]